MVLAVFIMLVQPIDIWALDFTWATNSGMINITGYTGSGGIVSIPATIEGKPVVKLSGFLFHGGQAECASPISVEIPYSVTNIDYRAFYLGDCVTNFTVSSFNPIFTNMDGVLFDKYIKNPDRLLHFPPGRCGTYSIPDGVRGLNAFGYSFAGCRGLTSLRIPSSLTNRIGMPEAYTHFYDCIALTNIMIEPSNAMYSSDDGVVFNREQSSLLIFPKGKMGPYTVPNSVTGIYIKAFSNTKYLTDVILTTNLTSISDGAFVDSSLTSIFLPSSISDIGAGAFQGTRNLSAIIIPTTTTNISEYAFSGCVSLNSIVIPDNVKDVGPGAFQECASLTNVVLSMGANNIKSRTFNDCVSLASISIPVNVTNI